jgi:hypothetical protein
MTVSRARTAVRYELSRQSTTAAEHHKGNQIMFKSIANIAIITTATTALYVFVVAALAQAVLGTVSPTVIALSMGDVLLPLAYAIILVVGATLIIRNAIANNAKITALAPVVLIASSYESEKAAA